MEIDLNQIKSFGNIDFLARQLVEGFLTGLHKSPYHGFSVEFAEHRLYNTGESTRHIDWKVYAKTERLYSKVFEEETNLRCHLVVDNSSSMHYPIENKGKITFSIMAAAALSYMLQRQRDAISLTTFSNDIEIHTAVKSTPNHLHKILLELENLLKVGNKSRNTSISKVLHQLAQKIHKRSLIILFSDMFENFTDSDEIFSALQHLKHKKHEILLFHITDHSTELNFNFADRPYEFIDIESGERLRLQPFEIKETFQLKMKEFYRELKFKCGQLKIDLIEADINKGFNQILNAYLTKRTKMK